VITAAAFVLAASLGALGRAEAGRRWNQHDGAAWGSLVVNVTGSFTLGLLHDVGSPLITVVGVGGLGAFTTFSSFARDTVSLAEARQLTLCVAYVVMSFALGLGAAAIGMALG
jgi:CrcB protein